MSAVLLVAAAGIAIYPLMRAFLPMLALSACFSFFSAPITSFADSATMSMLGEDRHMYGRIRVGGTIGYAIAAPIAGFLVQDWGLKLAFWGGSALYFLAFLTSQRFVHKHPQGPATPVGNPILRLLGIRKWVLFLAVALAGGIALSATNSFFFPYMKQIGAATSVMGIALSVGVLTEIPILFFGNRILKALKPYGMLMVAMVITGIRLVLFGLNSSPTTALFLQIFNGMTFPAMWVAGVTYANENAPAGMSASAQGVFGATVFGFGMAIGGLFGGPLLEGIGGQGLFLIYGIVVLAVISIVMVLHSRTDEPAVTVPEAA
jgi:PPP family 3-phenylpropionic acid transporter